MERETRRQFIKNGVRTIGGGILVGGTIAGLGSVAIQMLRFWTAEVPHPTVGGRNIADAKATQTGFVNSLSTPVTESASQGLSEMTISIPSEVSQAQQKIDQGKLNDQARVQAGQLSNDESGRYLLGLGSILAGGAIFKAADLIPDPSEPQQENNHSVAPKPI